MCEVHSCPTFHVGIFCSHSMPEVGLCFKVVEGMVPAIPPSNFLTPQKLAERSAHRHDQIPKKIWSIAMYQEQQPLLYCPQLQLWKTKTIILSTDNCCRNNLPNDTVTSSSVHCWIIQDGTGSGQTTLITTTRCTLIPTASEARYPGWQQLRLQI